jgi:hypothetical protein
MNLGIMQPYFFPYIGYYQLIAAVDTFIIYDNIKYTKKGWINRNRLLRNGSDAIFSLPLEKGSDELNIIDRKLSKDFDRVKLLNQFKGAYSRAPYFEEINPLIERIVQLNNDNLFFYLQNSLIEMCLFLDIGTKIKVSSTLPIDHSLRSQEKVLAICVEKKACTYINPIGGTDLYCKDDFDLHGIKLKFLKTTSFEYTQFNEPFVPSLSIVDLLMFNSIDVVKKYIHTNFELIQHV